MPGRLKPVSHLALETLAIVDNLEASRAVHEHLVNAHQLARPDVNHSALPHLAYLFSFPFFSIN